VTSTTANVLALAVSTGAVGLATGTGTIGVGRYAANPVAADPPGSTGPYYDVEVNSGNEFTSVVILVCTLGPGGNTLDWWDGNDWTAFSDQTFDAAKSCVTATVTDLTSPSLSELVGTPIAVTTGAASTAGGQGYWEAGADGGIFAFGDAQFYGSMGGKTLNAPVVNMAATPDGQGYWEVASDGGIFAFGDASFYGSMGGQPLNSPIVDLVPTADGQGYWEVGADGGIFAFGDASFYGSMGGQPLNQPVVSMMGTPSGKGYWEVAKDGGIFAFGDASFYGSMGGQPLNSPIVGAART